MSENPESRRVFAQRLSDAQPQIYAYICSLLLNASEASDILQETNTVLWKKYKHYNAEKPFLAWAFCFARFQTLAYLKRKKRERIVFNSAFVERAARVDDANAEINELRLRAMESCIDALPEHQRTLIRAKYYRGESVFAIAAEMGKTPNTVSALLYRVRAALSRCVRQKTAFNEWDES